jgi:ABC-2 type transport system permease protein
MLDLKRVTLVAKREWWARVRQRSFQITTLVQILFVLIGGALPVIIGRFTENSTGPSSRIVMVVDQTDGNIAEQLRAYLTDTGNPDLNFEVRTGSGSADEARALIDDGEIDAGLVVTRGPDEALAFTYVNADGETDGDLQYVQAAVAGIALQDNLRRAGIEESAFQEAAAPPVFSVEGVSADGGDVDEIDGTHILLSYFFTIIMFMAIMLYGNWIAQGVVEEKSSRIMEIMINAATPRDLLAGKIFGIGGAAMTQLVPMLLTGGLVFGLQKPLARALDVDTSTLPDIDFGAVSVTGVGWFLVYFVLGFTLYAAMYAGLGSLVSRQEEVNQATSPMTTVMMVGYFAGFFTMYAPDSLATRIVSIVPLTSPFVMVSRTINTDVPAWEMALSLVLLVITMALALMLAARIYRTGVLLYGQKPKLRAIFGQNLTTTAR